MTALKPQDFPRFISSGWRHVPVILVHGADEGAVRDTVSSIIAAAAGPNPDPMNLIALDGETVAQDPPRLADELRTFGLFGGMRIVHLRNAARVPVSAVEAAANEPAADTLLVMEAGELTTKAPLRALCDRHKAIAALPCYTDNARAVQALIDQILNAEGLAITREARDLLTAELGADRALSRSEIEKLALYARGQREIDATMVAEIISDAGRHDTSALIDAAMTGQLAAIEPEANRLFAAGINPAGLLAQTIGHVFLLRRLAQSGQTGEALVQQRRIHFSRVPAINRALSMWTETKLDRALRQVADTTLQTRKTPRLAEALTIRSLWALARIAAPPR